MRVLMAHSFHYRRGGDSTYVHTLTSALEAGGHEVVPFAMRHPQNEPSRWERWFVPFVDPKRRTVAAVARAIFDPESARALRRLIRTTRPDVLHVHHAHRHLTPSIVFAAASEAVPVVWTAHDYELVCPNGLLYTHGEPCTRCLGHRYTNAILHRCKHDSTAASAAVAAEKTVHAAIGLWDRIDRVLAPSAFMARKLVQFGMPVERVHTLHYGAIPPEPASGAGEGAVYAGRLVQEKGLSTLAAAADRLSEPIDVYGEGPLVVRSPNLRLHGRIPADQLDRRLRSARVVVVPSLWYENLPYAVIEAQLLGRAVVASHTGGIPELIEDGVDGLLVPPGDPDALADAIERLLRDPLLARRLGSRAREHALVRHDLRTHLQRVLAHYDDVISHP